MGKVSKKQTTHRHFYQKKPFLWTVGIILGICIALLLAFKLSPWPGALVIRYVFAKDDTKSTQALEKHASAADVTVLSDQNYRSGDNDAMLDVYLPRSTAQTSSRLPVVIWTHGGAWISGGKDSHDGYYKLLANEGYVVISAGYSIAPEKQYPTPVFQLNDMYAYIEANVERFHADTSRIVLGGDSAGAQLSSQMATIITNPTYAAEMNIRPSMNSTQLKGVLLNCGIYKMDGLVHPDPTLPKIVGWGDDVSVWAYIGTRDFSSPLIKQMSAYYHVDKAFPPTYITGGNGDPLTDAQSKPFADKLESLGVNVSRLFYDQAHQPSLPHEYQFNLDNDDGKAAFKATTTFLKEVTR